MSDLSQRLSKSQVEKLSEHGISSLYELITYLPSELIQIKPWQASSSFSSPNESNNLPQKFLFNGWLRNIYHRKQRSRYLLLDFVDIETQMSITCYLFSITKFTLATLKTAQQYQLLLTKGNGLWTLDKYANLKDVDSNPNFILGKAAMQNYLLPKYPAKKSLSTSFWHGVHNKLLDQDYVLNLKGLVPTNSTLAELINLKPIHHPHSIQSYENGMQSLIRLKSFLKIALVEYVNFSNQTKLSKLTQLDQPFLSNLSNNLPFQLSSSQKLIIWEILKDISY